MISVPNTSIRTSCPGVLGASVFPAKPADVIGNKTVEPDANFVPVTAPADVIGVSVGAPDAGLIISATPFDSIAGITAAADAGLIISAEPAEVRASIDGAPDAGLPTADCPLDSIAVSDGDPLASSAGVSDDVPAEVICCRLGLPLAPCSATAEPAHVRGSIDGEPDDVT